MNKENYVFNDIDQLLGHIVHFLDNPTPLKVQKSLYFLWAFYSATYGNINYDENSEFSLEGQTRYPSNLFDAQFEAWEYGPVINHVFSEYHKTNGFEGYSDINKSDLDSNKKEVLGFVDDLLSQINDVNDFGLVNRSHQDEAWKKAYHQGEKHCKIDNDEIKRDYIGYVEKQSEI